MPRTIRTFVAVETSPEVRTNARKLMTRLDTSGAKVKWVEPENLHLTLKFLGEVDARELPLICQAVQTAVEGLDPFDLEMIGAGAFPKADRPRTVWLGAGRGSEEMVVLHDSLEKHLLPLGFRGEGRRFRPHLTIGRVRGGPAGIRELADLLIESQEFPAGLISADEVVVFSSDLGRDGPTYEALSVSPLGGK